MAKVKPVFTRSIYLSGEEAIAVVNACLEIAEREDLSFNKMMLEALKEYARRHGVGNPVTQLMNWIENPDIRAMPIERGKVTVNHVKDYPKEELRRFLEGAKHEVRVFEEALKGEGQPASSTKKYWKALFKSEDEALSWLRKNLPRLSKESLSSWINGLRESKHPEAQKLLEELEARLCTKSL